MKITNKAASALLTALACGIAVVLCAPQQQQQQATTTSLNTNQSAPKVVQQQQQQPALSSVASELSLLPSLVQLRAQLEQPRVQMQHQQQQQQQQQQQVAALDTFDGKNPFADESLWQIPVHLVRDSSEHAPAANGRQQHAQQATGARGDSMAREASEMSAGDESLMNENDENDNEDVAASPAIISASTTSGADLKTAAGYHHSVPHYGAAAASHDDHHGHHYGGKYFQYASVPYPYAWDFGYRRGNPYHTIERYEHGKGPHFQTKVKWADKHGGYGVHVWDYNHDDHHSHHHYGGDHGDHYDSKHHHHEPLGGYGGHAHYGATHHTHYGAGHH